MALKCGLYLLLDNCVPGQFPACNPDRALVAIDALWTHIANEIPEENSRTAALFKFLVCSFVEVAVVSCSTWTTEGIGDAGHE